MRIIAPLSFLSLSLSLLCSTAATQSPGALWSLTPNVTGSVPTQRRENPGTASDTKLYVFGGRAGNSGGAPMNDLYEFDGKTWTQLSANGASGSPPQRDKAGVCWDFKRGKLIVFGGEDTSGTLLNDTWEFDPVTTAWKDITPASNNPSARRWLSIAYDPTTGAVILFGGLDASSTHLADTWMFNGGLWTQLTPTGAPSTRRQHHLVTRPDFGDVVLCGGQDTTITTTAKFRTDVWRFVGLNWVQIATTTSPAATVANDAAYDEIRRRIVLTGGNSIAGVQPTGEISEFDCVDNAWVIRRGPTAPDPVIGRISRYFTAFVPALGKIYKISGQVPNGGASPTTTCEYQTDALSTATAGSVGCVGSAGTPELVAPDLAWLGRTMVLEVRNTPATSSTLLGFSFTTSSIPLSLLGLGPASCVLTLNPLLVFGAPKNTNGNPELSIAIPNDPNALSAPPLLVQGLVSTGPNAAIVSNRLDVKLGAL
ncbi:MAG: hypothetical protein H6837_08985 [Planctomycetes bacterium]|nr:hypothetical protein [Planctomycetota bacterium]